MEGSPFDGYTSAMNNGKRKTIHLKVSKILALGALGVWAGSVVASAQGTPVFFVQDLSILFTQTRVRQIQKSLRETINGEELQSALEELKSKGDEALNLLNEMHKARTALGPGFRGFREYECQVNRLMASVIAGFRYPLNKAANASTQIKAASLLLELNQKLFSSVEGTSQDARNPEDSMRREALLSMGELAALFVVLDPIAKNLRHPDTTMSAKSLENLRVLNRILFLMKETYDFTSRDSESLSAKTAQSNLHLLSPYLRAAAPALKFALSSEDARIQKGASLTLRQIEALSLLSKHS